MRKRNFVTETHLLDRFEALFLFVKQHTTTDGSQFSKCHHHRRNAVTLNPKNRLHYSGFGLQHLEERILNLLLQIFKTISEIIVFTAFVVRQFRVPLIRGSRKHFAKGLEILSSPNSQTVMPRDTVRALFRRRSTSVVQPSLQITHQRFLKFSCHYYYCTSTHVFCTCVCFVQPSQSFKILDISPYPHIHRAS